jgi:hypothetical protein
MFIKVVPGVGSGWTGSLPQQLNIGLKKKKQDHLRVSDHGILAKGRVLVSTANPLVLTCMNLDFCGS